MSCLAELYEPRTLHDLPKYLPRFLASAVSADLVAYNEVDLKLPRISVSGDEPVFLNPLFLRAFEAHMHEHPLIRHQQRTGDVSARKISDFLSRSEYHRLGIYQEVYKQIGGEDQFALMLHVSPNRIVALAMNRRRRSFTEEDRRLLNLLQPHLVQAYRNAVGFTFLKEQLETVLAAVHALPHGVVVLNRRLSIQFASARAQMLLDEYFPDDKTAAELPPALRRWATRSDRWKGQALPNATSDFVLEQGGRRLLVKRVPGSKPGESILLLDQSGSTLSAQPLRSLGLTARQAEVLLWVAQGKSNPEIAVIIGAASRTVQKHVEHIFNKLHVETRTAAARRALEILNSAGI